MPDACATFALDVGKTNVRVAALSDRGEVLELRERPNVTRPAPPYPHFDVDELQAFVIEALRELARDHAPARIVPVGHGACAALVDVEEHELVLPVLDYEYPGVEYEDAAYEVEARDFARTGSPRLPGGLNLGRQLHWLERTFGPEFARVSAILPLPQYWAWWLSGRVTSESTSLGCHTDLWAPHERDFSPLAKDRGWAARFGERVRPWTALGPLREELRSATGIDEDALVVAGLHDSNASFFPHLLHHDDAPFAVVSTGTWVIVMASESEPGQLDPARDHLIGVDANGRPVATARFMGGREYAAIAGEDGLAREPRVQDLESALEGGALALPAFAGSGPFPGRAGAVRDLPTGATPEVRAALAALYCALVTDLCLELVGARGDTVVEGRFAANEAYLSALRGLRKGSVRGTQDATGTLGGAYAVGLVSQGGAWTHRGAEEGEPAPLNARLVEALAAHRERWRAALA